MTSNPDEWIVCEHRAFVVVLMRSSAISRNIREFHFCFILRDELRCVLRPQRGDYADRRASITTPEKALVACRICIEGFMNLNFESF